MSSRNLPTIFIYNEGELKHQMLTLRSLGGDNFRADDLEWWLASKDIVGTELEEDPANNRKTIIRSIGKHTIHSASVYSDDEDDEKI